MEKVSPRKFYKLFLKEIIKSNILSFWHDNKEWTRRILNDKNSIMRKIADELRLRYWNEYFYLDGIFFRKEIKYGKLSYTQNIEIIIESENDYRTIDKEIYKLIPLFVAPLKVIITYFNMDIVGSQNAIEKIKKSIIDRIKIDDSFGLHRNKIKILLILGFYKNEKISWQASVYCNKKFKSIVI